MKYILVLSQIIFLSTGLIGQGSPSLIGETYVCPGDIEVYNINDGRCATISSSEWEITHGTNIYFGLEEATEVHWNFDTDASLGTVSVSYVCYPPGDEDPIVVEDLTLDVEIRQIQVPLFDEDFVEHPFGDNSSFPISTTDQGENFTYSWSFPDCLPGNDGLHYTTITPDMYGFGTVCLTVHDNQCDTDITECIEVRRSCEDIITYSYSDIIPFFTSADLLINTIGEVVPALPNVEFKAGESINLNPGFIANAEFLAHIGPCGRSPDAEGCIGFETSGLVQGFDQNGQMESAYLPGQEKVVQDRQLLIFGDDIGMKIFPNPARDNIAIAIENYNPDQNYKYEVLSISGLALRSGKISNQEISIDIDNLNAGIYLVKVFTEDDISIARLVKL